MLRKLYVDNYKCLVNFTLPFAKLQPLFGPNGSGKSTVIEVVGRARRLVVEGEPTASLFPVSSLTRWDERSSQFFELEVEGNGGVYSYRVEIGHERARLRSHIAREELRFDGTLLFLSQEGEVQLFRDDGSKGPPLSTDKTRSLLSTLSARHDNVRLTWFKAWMRRLTILHLEPRRMASRSEEEIFMLDEAGTHFASWYRHLSQEKIGAMFGLLTSLREAIDGFESLALTADGESIRVLKAILAVEPRQQTKPRQVTFDFSELSDGQRALIVLYTLLHCALDAESLVLLDEPLTSVALPEIQPWLIRLRDAVSDGPAQVVIVSHHAEAINYLAGENALRFERNGGGPVRVQPFSFDQSNGLSAAEMVARGWES